MPTVHKRRNISRVQGSSTGPCYQGHATVYRRGCTHVMHGRSRMTTQALASIRCRETEHVGFSPNPADFQTIDTFPPDGAFPPHLGKYVNCGLDLFAIPQKKKQVHSFLLAGRPNNGYQIERVMGDFRAPHADNLTKICVRISTLPAVV